ncbi:MAG: 50S ribosomal protein L35 [Myxococcota bacterium]
MPKMKTHRGAAKRFSKTGSGKIKFKHAGMRHNFGSQTHVQKKRLIKTGIMCEADARKVRRMLNGG